MLLVSVGVVVSSYGEIHFNVVGTVYQVTGIFAEALRLVLTQVLLQKKGLTLNPITSLYYIAPCRYPIVCFWTFFWIWIESEVSFYCLTNFLKTCWKIEPLCKELKIKFDVPKLLFVGFWWYKAISILWLQVSLTTKKRKKKSLCPLSCWQLRKLVIVLYIPTTLTKSMNWFSTTFNKSVQGCWCSFVLLRISRVSSFLLLE